MLTSFPRGHLSAVGVRSWRRPPTGRGCGWILYAWPIEFVNVIPGCVSYTVYIKPAFRMGLKHSGAVVRGDLFFPGFCIGPCLPRLSRRMADCDSQGMSACTPIFDRFSNILENGAIVNAPKKRPCCRRRIVTTPDAESEIFLDHPDGYVLFFFLSVKMK